MAFTATRLLLGGENERRTDICRCPRYKKPLGKLLRQRADHALLEADPDARRGARQHRHP